MLLVNVQRCMRHKLALPHRLNRGRALGEREGNRVRETHLTVVTVADIVQLSSALVSPVKHLISTTTILVARQDQQKYLIHSPIAYCLPPPRALPSTVTLVIVTQYANCLTVDVGKIVTVTKDKEKLTQCAMVTKIELAGETAGKIYKVQVTTA